MRQLANLKIKFKQVTEGKKLVSFHEIYDVGNFYFLKKALNLLLLDEKKFKHGAGIKYKYSLIDSLKTFIIHNTIKSNVETLEKLKTVSIPSIFPL